MYVKNMLNSKIAFEGTVAQKVTFSAQFTEVSTFVSIEFRSFMMEIC